MGGLGGPGAVNCSEKESTCAFVALGGPAGDGGRGGLIGGKAGMDGYRTLPLDSALYAGYTPYSNGLDYWTNTIPGYLPGYPYPITYDTGITVDGTGNPEAAPQTGGYPDPNYLPGTESSVLLAAGTHLAAWADEFGNFLSPTGTQFKLDSITPYVAVEPYVTYVVKNPAALPAGWWIRQSLAAPGFGQPGGGTQFEILASADGTVPGSINTLLALGYLAYVKP